MIDTVVITLDKNDFIISKPTRFSPSAVGLILKPYYPKSNQGYFKCVNNPKKKDIQKHGYLPRLTLIARNNEEKFLLQLRIEFSAPKILYGNNFDELKSEDFYELIAELKEKLKIMGVITTEDKLINANVSTIHFSKNIRLDKYTKCSYILKELGKINLNQILDLSSTDYRNYGHSVRYHANSYEIIFYDKVKDLDRSRISEKRCIEKDNYLQLDLFKKIQYDSKINVLRMEVRLNNKRVIYSNLKKINMPIELTFHNLFSARISKSILIHYFNLIWKNWHIDCKSDIKPEDLFIEIERSRHYKPKKIISLIGTLALVNSIGIQGLRNLLSTMNYRTWQRTKSEILDLDLDNTSNHRLFPDIFSKLDKFERIKISDFNLVD
ncbi:MAG: hypothetical protein WD000_07035 [Thermodesulfobacteriota bacterium]